MRFGGGAVPLPKNNIGESGMVRGSGFIAAGVVAGAFALSQPAQARAQILAAINPQPLATAIETWARVSGLQVIYGTELADGMQSPGAPAGATPEEALTRILSGSGLIFSWLNDRTVSI